MSVSNFHNDYNTALITPKILVVDDIKDNHRVIASLLTDLDATIYNACSGEDALSLTLRHQFAVILLDVMMPRMDGFETASLMRINEDTKYTPIIFITAAEPDDDYECRGYDAGAVDYLFKPIKPHALVGKVKVFLELERQRHKIRQTLDDIQRFENRNKLLLKSVGEGILGMDKDGFITFSNPAAQRLLGYSESQLDRKNIMDVMCLADSREFRIKWEDTAVFNRCARGRSHHENIGVFWNRKQVLFPVEYTATPIEDGGVFLGVVIAFQDITERKKTEEQLSRLAQHDALTGLVNRNAFGKLLMQALARAQRSKHSLALLFIDLDRFKQVNDNLGHDIGDSLLQETAIRLKKCVRDGDIIGRLGGDEFTVLLESINVGRNAAVVAHKIITGLSTPFLIRDHQVFVGASIGIATYPESAQKADALMRCADIAMYKAKQAGRNNYQFFTEAMQREVRNELALENELRYALQEQEFLLHYQPKIDPATDRIVGMEALLRWRGRDGRLISPDKFITKAEEMGLIIAIGEWVLNCGCQQMRKWQVSGCLTNGETIAINLSMRQLFSPDLPAVVEQILNASGLAPAYLELEVTESMMMQSPSTTIETLKAIHRLGVKITIDDFGTGYSSLSYLRQLPIDALKIDKSFVQELGDNSQNDAIVKAIVNLAHNLGLKVVAEGVETQVQLDFLQQHGCDVIQGYFYSRPVSAVDFTAYIQSPPANKYKL